MELSDRQNGTLPEGSAPLVTVVVPVGSVDAQLQRQLEAICGQQTTTPFDVVLSLNDARPSARVALDTIARPWHQVRIVDSSQRRGAAHARNAGASATGAAVLAFCDADDLVHDGWLSALLVALDDADAVTGHVNELMPERQRHWRPPATPGALPTFLGQPYVLSGNLAITRAAFDAVGGFDESLTRCEDIALGWSLGRLGYQLAYEPHAVIDYRHRTGFVSMLQQHYRYGRGMSEVLLRHRPPNGADMRGAALLRPNRQVAKRSFANVMRRASIAAGRAVGLVQARVRSPLQQGTS